MGGWLAIGGAECIILGTTEGKALDLKEWIITKGFWFAGLEFHCCAGFSSLQLVKYTLSSAVIEKPELFSA